MTGSQNNAVSDTRSFDVLSYATEAVSTMCQAGTVFWNGGPETKRYLVEHITSKKVITDSENYHDVIAAGGAQERDT